MKNSYLQNVQQETTKKPIPVCVVAGFLGSGKTTLVNHILNANHGLNITVFVNDFADIDIDSQLLQSKQENTISLKNGCICCSIQGDLVNELQRLLNSTEQRPEYIVIETSGVSDPTKIINTMSYPQFKEILQLDLVLTLVNAEQLSSLQGQVRLLAQTQLDAADIVIINKVDCSSQEQLEEIHNHWLYPAARVIETSFSKVPIDILFSKQALPDSSSPLKSSQNNLEAGHEQLFESWSWCSQKVLCLNKLRTAVNQLSAQVYRAKGIFNVSQMMDPIVLQQVGQRQDWSKFENTQGSAKQRLLGQSEVVVIGTKGCLDAEQLKRDFDLCVVESVSQ